LSAHPEVAWVNYPGLPGHPDRARAERYFRRGAGAIVGFGIRGGLETARRFIDSVRLFSHLANIGDAKSLVIHPASTTHQQLSPEERAAVGVPDDFIRLSIGIEDADDLVADLDQAITAAARRAEAA
jgi:O-acetylhomoserine (thiol)-lyase